MSEVAQALGWIVSECQADSALMTVAVGGVWTLKADLATVAPIVLIVPQSLPDVLTMNMRRLFNHGLYQIKMVGPDAKYADLVTGADRIDALFKSRSSVALSVGGILASWREQALLYPDEVNGQAWSHLGGLYNIDVQGN